MKTVQMTLDEELVAAVDEAVRRLGSSRSAFTRRALRAALERTRAEMLEQRHRKGYRDMPVKPGEFEDWEDEHAWGD